MLQTEYPKAYFTTTIRTPSKPKFPTVVFRKLTSPEAGSDLRGGTVNAITYNIQVDVITNDEQLTADDLTYSVVDCMKRLRFQVVGDVYTDESNPDEYRSIARFRRIIGRGDRL